MNLHPPLPLSASPLRVLCGLCDKILKWSLGICILSLFVSCSSTDTSGISSFTGTAMTIDYRILVGHNLSQSDQLRLHHTITSVFTEVNSIYNKWNSDSELSQLNNHPTLTPFVLSPKLEKLLHITDKMVQITEGRFDPTIETVQARWKKGIPTEQQLQELAVGWEHLQFAQGQVTKLQDVKIDLGGIAKGYAVDLLLQAIKDEGFSNIYVEWGGEIATSGKHPAGRPWTVYISRLEDTSPENALAIIALENKAIATSGDYLQQWKMGDEVYFHIIDPRTKHPLKMTKTSVASATVCADTCVFADGIATAAMLFATEDEALKWFERVKIRYPEIGFWIMSRN